MDATDFNTSAVLLVEQVLPRSSGHMHLRFDITAHLADRDIEVAFIVQRRSNYTSVLATTNFDYDKTGSDFVIVAHHDSCWRDRWLDKFLKDKAPIQGVSVSQVRLWARTPVSPDMVHLGYVDTADDWLGAELNAQHLLSYVSIPPSTTRSTWLTAVLRIIVSAQMLLRTPVKTLTCRFQRVRGRLSRELRWTTDQDRDWAIRLELRTSASKPWRQVVQTEDFLTDVEKFVIKPWKGASYLAFVSTEKETES